MGSTAYSVTSMGAGKASRGSARLPEQAGTSSGCYFRVIVTLSILPVNWLVARV